MDLVEVGSWGYQLGAIGILLFTLIFLAVTRWWTDPLGRILAFVFSAVSAVLLMSAYRGLTGINTHGFFVARAMVFWTFGAGVWTGLIFFIWAQFLAPRRKERKDEKARMADDRHSLHGDSYDHSGSHDR